MYRNEAICCQN